MKEIGDYLKKVRIDNGVSLDEASEDLNFSMAQLENIEEGNVRAFKDVFALKDLVRDYAKYLGVELEQIMDEFNDFMFEHTSKISLDDIKEAKALKKQENDKDKVVSPYTKIRIKKELPYKKIMIVLGIILLILIVIFIIIKLSNKEEKVTTELMGSEGNGIYEFTY